MHGFYTATDKHYNILFIFDIKSFSFTKAETMGLPPVPFYSVLYLEFIYF